MIEQSKLSVNAVIRIPAVVLSQALLEAAVGPLGRFEPSRAKGTNYAQISPLYGFGWPDVLALVERVGPALQGYFERGEVGRPRLDVAFCIQSDCVSASLLVPTEVVAALGRFGFDFEASAYLAAS